MKTVDQVVELLSESELKHLAAERLESERTSVYDILRNIVCLKKRVRTAAENERQAYENALVLSIGSFESTKRILERYSLWDPNYDKSFKVAVEDSRLQFFGTSKREEGGHLA